MRTSQRAATRTHLSRSRHCWLRRLLLAMSLVVVALSIVGMHQLSLGHDVVTGPTASSAHAGLADHSGSADEMLAMAMPGHSGGHIEAGVPDGGVGHACPDCADHQMAFGSCLLALTLLVLTWLLTPPRPRHVLPFLLPSLAPPASVSVGGRLLPALSLAELSVRRT